MRLWSIHPKYLDSVGLVALWREALLAKRVLQGRTKGYKHHPQLARFLARQSPVLSINAYLYFVWQEANRSGYSFDKRKLGKMKQLGKIPVSSGQLSYEMNHLRKKLKARNKDRLSLLVSVDAPDPHPIFVVRRGDVEKWEKT